MQDSSAILKVLNSLQQFLAFALCGLFLAGDVIQLLLCESSDKSRVEQLERRAFARDQEVTDRLIRAVVDKAQARDVIVGLQNVVNLLDVVVRADWSFRRDWCRTILAGIAPWNALLAFVAAGA